MRAPAPRCLRPRAVLPLCNPHMRLRCGAGQVGVDDALVQKKFNDAEDIVEMNNGCICCTGSC